MSSKEVKSFLTEKWIAKLGTINKDGSPHVAPVWFEYDGKHMLIAVSTKTRKAKNAMQDNRVCVCVENSERPYRAMIIQGMADVYKDDEASLRIARRYLGIKDGKKHHDFLLKRYGPRVILRIAPTETITWDHRKGRV